MHFEPERDCGKCVHVNIRRQKLFFWPPRTASSTCSHGQVRRKAEWAGSVGAAPLIGRLATPKFLSVQLRHGASGRFLVASLIQPPTVQQPIPIVMFCNHCLRMAAARRQLPLIKQLSTSAWLRTSEQILSTPVTLPGESSSRTRAAPRSICPEGTVLQGLNYQKNGHDPVAMKDEDYPEWLWSCLDVVKVAEAGIEESADEFCMLADPLSLSLTCLITPCSKHCC